MQNNPLESIVIGGVIIVIGFAIILCHRSIKEHYDRRMSKGWPIGLGDFWTGKYTKGGLIITYAIIILAGTACVGFGIGQILGVLTP
jgi:hypothetical protein